MIGSFIDYLKDKKDNILFPRTITEAVADKESGENLNQMLEGIVRTAGDEAEYIEDLDEHTGEVLARHDAEIQNLENYIGSLDNLTTEQKSNIVSAVNEVGQDVVAHNAKTIQQSGGVHGLEIERGSWVAELSTTNGDGVADYGSYERFGTYVRIGDLVYISFRMNVESFTNCTGYYIITGLPFYSSGSDRYRYIVAPSNLEGATDYASIRGTDIRMRSSPQAVAQAVPFTSTKYIHGSGVYHIG